MLSPASRTPNENGTIRARCYREQCHIRVVTAHQNETNVTLKNRESKDLPLDSDFDLSFEKTSTD